jgi:hypothetical protein
MVNYKYSQRTKIPIHIKYDASMPLMLLKELMVQCLLWCTSKMSVYKKYGVIKMISNISDHEIDAYLHRNKIYKYVLYKRGNIKLSQFSDNFDHLL